MNFRSLLWKTNSNLIIKPIKTKSKRITKTIYLEISLILSTLIHKYSYYSHPQNNNKIKQFLNQSHRRTDLQIASKHYQIISFSRIPLWYNIVKNPFLEPEKNQRSEWSVRARGERKTSIPPTRVIISQSGRKDLRIDRWIKIRIRLPEAQVTGFLHALRCVELDLNARPISRAHACGREHTWFESMGRNRAHV